MAAAESVVVAIVTVAALALTAIAVRAWRASGNGRAAILSLAFAVLAAKGLFLSIALFIDAHWERPGLLAALLFDGVALGLFYGAVLRRSPS